MLRFWSNSEQRGNAIVEFALVLPVLLLITFGIADVGRYAYYSIVVANAARAGAAYGAQNNVTANDTKGIDSAVTADAGSASSLLTTSAPSFFCETSTFTTINCSDTTGAIKYEYVQVTVSGTFKPLIKYPKVPGTITISDTAKMRILCITGCS